MSLHLPGRVHGRHRSLTPHQLSQHAAALETANDDLQQRLTATAARSNELEAMVATLDRDLNDMTAERDQLLADVRALRADLATRDAVTVPPMQRDTSDGADQATAPYGIHVRPLWDALGTSTADTVRLPITDPAHILGAA